MTATVAYKWLTWHIVVRRQPSRRQPSHIIVLTPLPSTALEESVSSLSTQEHRKTALARQNHALSGRADGGAEEGPVVHPPSTQKSPQSDSRLMTLENSLRLRWSIAAPLPKETKQGSSESRTRRKVALVAGLALDSTSPLAPPWNTD